jgi:ubiquinone/menaquinone biosynthesis C-methylase UbiE
MNGQPAWQWNEIQQVGTDYSDVVEVERYEKRMGEIRDLPGEDAAILKTLALPENSHLLEIGTGSGHFARAAAKAGYRVTAVDVSPAMLRYAEARAKSEGLKNVEFCHAGFLTFSAESATFDAVVSVTVLHHLPDLWKAIALKNIHRMLKPGGLLLLGDVVFSSSGSDPMSQFDAFVNAMPEGMREAAIGHIAKEYSTLDWIMEGLLTRAGFQILRTVADHAPLIQYLCRAEGAETAD